jgi:ABC-2 type transport system ATP-binding protein
MTSRRKTLRWSRPAAVRKRFGDVEALAGLDLVAPAGQTLAVLGPNGAGKTTFVRMLATLLRPDAGEVRLLGIDVAREPQRVRRAIGLAASTRRSSRR